MYYGLEACPVNKLQIKSLHFAINSAFRKKYFLLSRMMLLMNVCHFLIVLSLRQFILGKLNF